MGAAGPHTWDCSSFTQAAYAQIGVKMPRTATAQRNWLAAGNGTRIQPGQEKPGDLIFWDSYRRTQPDRARHDHLEPSQQNHDRSTQHPCRRRTLQLRQRPKPPHLRNLAPYIARADRSQTIGRRVSNFKACSVGGTCYG